LANVTKTTDLTVPLRKSEMRDKAGVVVATLDNNWETGIEAAKKAAPSDYSEGDKKNDSPKPYKTLQYQ
jgi:hypothetical protein